MYRLFLDFKEKALLVPKEVTDAVGATDDFGIWLSTTRTDIKITHAAYQLSRPEPGKPGRPSKLRSNMDQWDEKEKAYRRSIGMLAIHSPIVSELSASPKSRFMIRGKKHAVSKEEFKDSVEEELCDVLYYTLKLANTLGVELEEWIPAKERYNSSRYPCGIDFDPEGDLAGRFPPSGEDKGNK